MSSTIAIIMRARNEMPHVQRTVDMLRRQTFQNFDLYAVDSGSTDGTLEVLRAHCAEGMLTQIKPEDYVPGKVLNNAIGRTGHALIVLLNADAIPLSEEWLERLISPLLDDQADATFSKQSVRDDARFIVAYDYARAYGSGHAPPDFFSAAACAFKRTLWERFRFHENGYAEDAVWAATCQLSKARFMLVPESAVEHSHNYSLRELYQKRFRHGQSFANYLDEPSPIGLRLYRCFREVVRDLLYACSQLKIGTIPYNLAYRVTIHAGLHRGIKASRD